MDPVAIINWAWAITKMIVDAVMAKEDPKAVAARVAAEMAALYKAQADEDKISAKAVKGYRP